MDKKTVRSNIKKARDSMTSKEVCDKSRLITENILKILEKEEFRADINRVLNLRDIIQNELK